MSDLKSLIRPGDVINLEGRHWDWKNLFVSVGEAVIVPLIVRTQEKVFGVGSDHRDYHTMTYLGDNRVFSTQFPKPEIVSLDEFDAADKKRTVSVFRMNPAYFGRGLKDSDLTIMSNAAMTMADVKLDYDLLQNAMIGINALSGYPWSYHLRWLDADGKGVSEDPAKVRQHFVCSVAAAAVIAYWRHELLRTAGEDLPQPWKKLNPAAWTERQIREYPGHWDINATFPANFAVTQTHFSHEFLEIGHFKAGTKTPNIRK